MTCARLPVSFWVLLALGLALRCLAINQPLIDAGILRQAQTAAATSRRVAASSSSPSKRSASHCGTLAPVLRAKFAVCLKFWTGTMPGRIGMSIPAARTLSR